VRYLFKYRDFTFTILFQTYDCCYMF